MMRQAALLVALLTCSTSGGPAFDAACEIIGPPRRPSPSAGTPDTEAIERSLAAHVQARAAFSRGEYRDALKSWRTALLADQGNAAAWRGIALSSGALGLYDMAESAWQRRLDLAPDDHRAQGIVGESAARAGQLDDALALLCAARGRDVEGEGQDSTMTWRRDLLLMRLLRQANHLDASLELRQALTTGLPAAMAIEPPSNAADAQWRRLLHQAQQMGEGELARLGASARGTMGAAVARVASGTHLARANACGARFHSAELALLAYAGVDASVVLETLHRIESTRPIHLMPDFRSPMTMAEALWRSAVMSSMLGHEEVAMDLLELAYELDPTLAQVLQALSWSLLDQDGSLDRAAGYAIAAMEQDRLIPAHLLTFGRLLLAQRKPESALPVLQQARAQLLKTTPVLREHGGPLEDPETLLLLGDAHARVGQDDEAQAAWRTALNELTGPAGRWRLAESGDLQRREWGLQVVDPEALYDLRFSRLEAQIRSRLAGLMPDSKS